MERRCPDCDVEMEPVDLVASGYTVQVQTEDQRDGLLGSLGLSKKHSLEGRLCPECGQVRTYVDLNDDDHWLDELGGGEDDDHWLDDGDSDADRERRDPEYQPWGERRDQTDESDDDGWL